MRGLAELIFGMYLTLNPGELPKDTPRLSEMQSVAAASTGGKRRAVAKPEHPDLIIPNASPSTDVTFTNQYNRELTLKACVYNQCEAVSVPVGHTASIDDLGSRKGPGPIEVLINDPILPSYMGKPYLLSSNELGFTQLQRDAVIPAVGELHVFSYSPSTVNATLSRANGTLISEQEIPLRPGDTIITPSSLPGYEEGSHLRLQGTFLAYTQLGNNRLAAQDTSAGEQFIIPSNNDTLYIHNPGDTVLGVTINSIPPNDASRTGTMSIPQGGMSTSTTTGSAASTTPGGLTITGSTPFQAWTSNGTPSQNKHQAATPFLDIIGFNRGTDVYLMNVEDVATEVGLFEYDNTGTVQAQRTIPVPAKSVVVVPTTHAFIDISSNHANVYASRIDGQYNQVPRERPVKPRITGLDYNNDGIVDNPDADKNGIIDHIEGVDCQAPWPWKAKLVVSPAAGPFDAYTFAGKEFPQGFSLNSQTGEITYSPPCTTAGSRFYPNVTVSGNPSAVEMQFLVK